LLQCYEARIAALDSHCCARNYHKRSGPRPSNNRAKGSRHVPHAGTSGKGGIACVTDAAS
jgi:hypothetical protein